MRLDWTGRGIVIDLSAVHQDPDALTVVMIAATGWLQALLAAPESDDVPRRIQVLEEIWALLGSERVAKYYQSCQKLARSYGVANISVAHRISDLRAQSDDGTSAAKVSMGILADTQTRILFRQSSDQVPEATALLGLTNVEAEILPRLARGRALWRVGDHTAIVQHRIGSAEWDICDTEREAHRMTPPRRRCRFRRRRDLVERLAPYVQPIEAEPEPLISVVPIRWWLEGWAAATGDRPDVIAQGVRARPRHRPRSVGPRGQVRQALRCGPRSVGRSAWIPQYYQAALRSRAGRDLGASCLRRRSARPTTV